MYSDCSGKRAVGLECSGSSHITDKFSCVTDTMCDVLHWLPECQRIHFNLCYVIRCVISTAPAYLQELCVPVRETVQRQRLRSATHADLCALRVATNRFGRPGEPFL